MLAGNEENDYSITSVTKALDLLELLAEQEHEVRLADIVAKVDLPKSSVFRSLATLEKRGYVERVGADGAYVLGTRIFELASRVAGRANVRDLALPHMQNLRNMYSETINLGILSQWYVVYLELLESTHVIRMSAQVGARDHAHSTALGKAILAYLSPAEVEQIIARTGMPRFTDRTITTLSAFHKELARVRQDGYAIDDSENENGVACIGAPIFEHLGRPIASVSISCLSDRIAGRTLSIWRLR